MWKSTTKECASSMEDAKEAASQAGSSALHANGKLCHGWMIVPAIAVAVGLGTLYYLRGDLQRYIKMSRM